MIDNHRLEPDRVQKNWTKSIDKQSMSDEFDYLDSLTGSL